MSPSGWFWSGRWPDFVVDIFGLKMLAGRCYLWRPPRAEAAGPRRFHSICHPAGAPPGRLSLAASMVSFDASSAARHHQPAAAAHRLRPTPIWSQMAFRRSLDAPVARGTESRRPGACPCRGHFSCGRLGWRPRHSPPRCPDRASSGRSRGPATCTKRTGRRTVATPARMRAFPSPTPAS